MFGDNLPKPSPWPSDFPLPPGVYFQHYLASIRNGERQLMSMLRNINALNENGLPPARSILHNGPRAIERNCARYATLMREVGFDPAFGYGLDGRNDSDGTRLTATKKGEIMAGVARRTGSRLVLADLEGAHDTKTGPTDDTDEAGALLMGRTFREKTRDLPRIVVFDQSWFAIQSHGDNRVPVKPIGQGGSFKGFPQDELAAWVDASALQPYWRNFPQDNAYPFVFNWMERDYASYEGNLAKLDPKLIRPRTVTMQGYRHEKKPWDFVHALINYSDRPVIIWSDPHPVAMTLRCVKAARMIAKLGFKGSRAVADFQRSTNGKLTVDNAAGEEVFKYLGV